MTRTILILTLVALAPNAALAGDENKPWKNLTDVAFVNTGGNTEVTTLSLGEAVSYTADPWTASGLFVGIWGETAGETTTSLWKTAGRVDYALSPRLGLFGFAGWERNRFAGIQRRFDEGGGLSFKIVEPKPHTLRFDAGFSFNQQRSIDEVTDNFVAARLAGLYQFDFAEKAYFLQTVEVLPNLERGKDVRVNSESALIAPLWNRVALKVAYLLRYDREPEPGFEKTDRIFSTGLQVTF